MPDAAVGRRLWARRFPTNPMLDCASTAPPGPTRPARPVSPQYLEEAEKARPPARLGREHGPVPLQRRRGPGVVFWHDQGLAACFPDAHLPTCAAGSDGDYEEVNAPQVLDPRAVGEASRSDWGGTKENHVRRAVLPARNAEDKRVTYQALKDPMNAQATCTLLSTA